MEMKEINEYLEFGVLLITSVSVLHYLNSFGLDIFQKTILAVLIFAWAASWVFKDWKVKESIKINKDTKRKLEDLGRKGETFDSIVNRVLDSELLDKKKDVLK